MGSWFIYLIALEFVIAGFFYILQKQWCMAGYAISAAMVNLFILGASK